MIATLLLLCAQAPTQLSPELLVAHPGLFEGRYSEVREEQLSALEAEPDSPLAYAAVRSIDLLDPYCAEGIDPARLEKLASEVHDGLTQLGIKQLLEFEIHRRRFSDTPYPSANDLYDDFFDNWFLLGPYGRLDEPSPLWGSGAPGAPHRDLQAEYTDQAGEKLSWRAVHRERNDIGVFPDREVQPPSGGTAFLLASVEADVRQALLELTSPRQVQVYWNGELVHEELHVGLTHSEARMTIPVQLAEGPNTLLLRFENGQGASLAARLLQLDGRLLPNPARTSTSLETALRPTPSTDSSSVKATAPTAAKDLPFASCIRMLVALSNDRADRALAIAEPTSPDELAAWLRLRHLSVRSASHLPPEVYRRYQLEVEDRLESLGFSIPEIDAERALRLMDEDQVEDALNMVEQLVQAHPLVPRFHWIRNDALDALDPSGVTSRMAMRKTLQLFDDSTAWDALADEALERSDVAATIEYLTKSAAADGDASRLLGFLADGTPADIKRAEEIVARLKADEPGYLWYDSFQVRLDGQRRDFAAMEAAFKLDTTERPDKPGNWQRLASFHLRHGDDNEARTALQHVLEIAPGDRWARRALAQLGTVDSSEKFFREFAPDREAALAAAPSAAGASTALILDSRLVYVRDDGSQHSRTHQITLALDRTGTEQLQEQAELGETLLTQVLGSDGVVFEPILVNGSWVMPSLDPGDAVEMIYDDRVGASLGAAPNLPMWSFESFEQPFLVSRYVVFLPPGTPGKWDLASFTGDHEELAWQDGTVHVFEMRDRPRLEPESAAPSVRELISWVEYGEDINTDFIAQAMESNLAWQKDVAEDVGAELRKFVAQVSKEHSPEELPRALYDAVTEHVIEFRGAGDTTDVWYLKRGNPMGLLAALFDIAEVQYEWAVPFPVGPPELDTDPKRPFLTGGDLGSPWFRLLNSNGEPTWLFLPPGGRGYTYARVPESLAGSRFIVLGADGPRIESLPPAPTDTWMTKLEIDVFLGEEKTARVEAHFLMSDMRGPLTREAISQAEPQQREQGLRQMASGIVRGIDVTSWDVKEMLVRGNDLEITFEGTLKSFVRGSKSKPYCKLPWPPRGLSRAAGEGHRTSPFVLRSHQNERVELRIHASETWQFGTPPESKTLDREGLHYEIQFELDGDELTVVKEFRLHGLELTAEELAPFARELKDLEDLDTVRIPLSAAK